MVLYINRKIWFRVFCWWCSCIGVQAQHTGIQSASQSQRSLIRVDSKEQDQLLILMCHSEEDRECALEKSMLEWKYWCSCTTWWKGSNGKPLFLMRIFLLIPCLFLPKAFPFVFILTNLERTSIFILILRPIFHHSQPLVSIMSLFLITHTLCLWDLQIIFYTTVTNIMLNNVKKLN